MIGQIGEIEHAVCRMVSFTRPIFSGGVPANCRHVATRPERGTWEAPDQRGGYACGSHGSVLLDIETERLVLKLPDGKTREAEVPAGAWKYSCEGPADRLVDIAPGQGRNESPGHVGARAVEALHAIVASGKSGGAGQIIKYAQKAAAE